MFSSRALLHAIAWLSLAAVALALVSQHVFDMRPCAWCVFQRVLFLVIAVVCWATLALPRAATWALRTGALLVSALSVGGVLAAWYQHTVASNMFSCDMTFADQFMVKSGLDSAVPWLFGIFATCSDARVNLLGVEYALWALALFAVFSVVSLIAVFRPSR